MAPLIEIGSPERAQPTDPQFRSGEPDRQPVPPVPPAVVAAALDPDAAWTLVWVKPGTEVWRLDPPSSDIEGAPGRHDPRTRFAKVGAPGIEAAEVLREAEHLRWLAAHRPGDAPWRTPEPVTHGVGEHGEAWSVTGPLDGIPASDHHHRVGGRPDELAEQLGRALAAFHGSLDPAAAPMPIRDPRTLVDAAEARWAAGGIEADRLGAPFSGHPVGDAVRWLDDHAPAVPAGPDLVVTHGDAGLPNLLLAGAGQPVGIVDLGRLAPADRHLDLAVLLRSFIANFGPEQAWRIVDAYGLPHPDPLRLEWYRLGDDLW